MKLALSFILCALSVFSVQAKTVDDLPSYSGTYICGNSGVSVQVSIDTKVKLYQGHIIHNSLYSVFDESGKILYSGSEYIGADIIYPPNKSKSMITIDRPENAVKVFVFKNGKPEETFFCAM